MTAQRWLQIHLVVLCLLGALFVALATENYLVPVVVLLAGCTAVIFTDTYRWFVLNRVLGNLAAVGAVIFSLRDFLKSYSEGQLLAISSLLVYLQLILFFQKKDARLYWQIMLLSLLQVVVGAALHLGFAFGALLIVYTAISVSAMVLFFIHREAEPHSTPAAEPPEAKTGSAKRLLGGPLRVRVLGNDERLQQAFLSPRLLRQIVSLTVAAMLFATVFFYAAPRHPAAAWSGARGFTRAQTGFSRTVELQQMGELLQSNELVMSVKLHDSSGKPLRLADVYFAGEVLEDYQSDDSGSRWTVAGSGNPVIARDDGVALPPLPELSAEYVVVHAQMRQMTQPTLFSIAPTYALPQKATRDDVRMDTVSRLIFRQGMSEYNYGQNFEYQVATTGVLTNPRRQAAIYAENRPLRPLAEVRRLSAGNARQFQEHQWLEHQHELARCRKWDPQDEKRFAGLKAEADRIVQSLGAASNDPVAVAHALEAYFQHPGRFHYSLNLNLPRNVELDPLEDFVTGHRTGHCQYFASALVLMLRSQGLPARMVVGYRGSDFNQLGKFYQVRQRNAHAWVELHLKKSQVPDHELIGGIVGEGGAWLRLDPTPAADRDNEPASRDWAGTARDWLDYVDTVWTDYVIGLNQQRQQEALYGAWEASPEQAESWTSISAWENELRMVAGWFGIIIGDKDQAGWNVAFDWRAAVSAMVLCGLLIGVVRGVRYLWQRYDWPSLWLWRKASVSRSTVPFYARLEEMLARRGRSRRLAETPREYVEHAVRELGFVPSDGLRRLVVAFYAVRYGGATLDSAELQAIEQALSELDRATADAR